MQVTGRFDEGRPVIAVRLEGSLTPIEVLVDTGFNGELMLTQECIRELSLPFIGDDEYMTASGDVVPTTVHMGTIRWSGRARKIAVLATTGKSNLLGMELLHFYRLDLARSQGRLTISDSCPIYSIPSLLTDSATKRSARNTGLAGVLECWTDQWRTYCGWPLPCPPSLT